MFSNPEFVKKHGFLNKDEGYNIYSTKTRIKTNLLGEITLGTAYFMPLVQAVPVMFLTDDQVKILHDKGIVFKIRKRHNPVNSETHLGFPSKKIFERIITF